MTNSSSLIHCVICENNWASGLIISPVFVEHVWHYGFCLEYEEKFVKINTRWIVLASQELLQLFKWGLVTSVPTLLFSVDGKRERKPLIHQIKLEMTSLQPNNCLVSKRQCGRQMDVKLDEMDDHVILGHMCSAAQTSFFIPTAGHWGPAERRGESELADQRENQAADASWRCKDAIQYNFTYI